MIKNKYISSVVIVGIIFLLLTFVFNLVNVNAIEKKEVYNPDNVYVDIKGAVKNPGVYEVNKDSRIIDQTTPNMIQRISWIFERKPLISREI